MPAIRTPGSPAPILISSTMTELANTRGRAYGHRTTPADPGAVRAWRLALPPRELYLAYLRHSDSAGCDLDSTGVHVQRIWVAAEWPVAFGQRVEPFVEEMGSSRVAMDPQRGRS